MVRLTAWLIAAQIIPAIFHEMLLTTPDQQEIRKESANPSSPPAAQQMFGPTLLQAALTNALALMKMLELAQEKQVIRPETAQSNLNGQAQISDNSHISTIQPFHNKTLRTIPHHQGQMATTRLPDIATQLPTNGIIR